MESDNNKTICGAKNRQGKPCQNSPVTGRTRCRMHGGATPRGGKGNPKHGLYTQALTPEEQAMFDGIQLGEMEREIRMAKIMLNRCLTLHAEIQQAPNDEEAMLGFELSEIEQSERGRRIVRKRPDTYALIDRFMGRIANLEKTRAELIAAQGERGEDAMDTARKVQDALKAMIAVETKQRTSSDDEDEPA